MINLGFQYESDPTGWKVSQVLVESQPSWSTSGEATERSGWNTNEGNKDIDCWLVPAFDGTDGAQMDWVQT